ncbi:excinuclease ABC subunit UvrC [bacterium]|nr:excinuclease ABC subunit UvrC [bacterium]
MDPALDAKIKLAPHEPGAYIFRDEEGRPIYVGKAGDLRDRLVQHTRGDNPAGWAVVMHERARDVEWIVTRSETEALLLEANLIKEHKPPYNIRLADDKSYPYLKITQEPFPRLLVIRDLPRDAQVHIPGGRGKVRRGFHDPKRHEVYGVGDGLVFGPYPTAAVMWKMRDIAGQVFGLRHCRKTLDPSRPLRPCLNFHIKRCVGPCRGEITPEEYDRIVEQVVMLLDGRTDTVRQEFEERMKQAAAELDFERAATYRDRIKTLEAASEDQLVNAAEERDQDVLAVALEGDFGVVDLFPVRAGRMLGPEHFSFSHVRGRLPSEVIEAAMMVHYSQHVTPPRAILLPEPLPEAAAWEAMLSDLREGKVELLVPRRGEKRRLVELAEKNAQVNLAQVLEERGRKREENLAALNDLAEVLEMAARPARIECYDISNLQGQDAVGSMVVFTDGLPDKRRYRRFKIHLEGKPDDYAMMAEMVQRRLRRGMLGDEKFLPLPDLLLVDGGKGQVSTIAAVLEEEGAAGMTLAGLAKREEEVFVPGQSDPVDMTEHPRGRFLLQRVRDEAHRFAHSYHEGLRSRTITRSQLDMVPGIGPTRRAALFRAFPSLQAMSEASVEELAAVEGMNRKAAQTLHEFLLDAAHEARPLPGQEE